MEQDKVNRLSEVGKKVWDEDSEGKRTAAQNKKKASFGQWWAEIRPTKTVVFWFSLASIILTMIVGFNWGGWMTGGTAQRLAEVTAQNAVIRRLAPLCVAQFNQDPGKDQKLTELQAASAFQQDDYVKEQGWATLPGEEKPDNKVAAECAKLLMLVSP
jgi:hypothetical protein